MAKYNAYVGTYSKGEAGGIFHVQLDEDCGRLTILGTTDVENPSHLCASPDGKFIYAACETGEFLGQNGGAVAALNVMPNGTLVRINTMGTKGKHPCYVCTSPDGKFVYAANYSEGTVTVLSVRADGGLDENPIIVTHTGSGPNAKRQEKPHVHCTRITPDGKYLAVCDLGIDKVMLYPLCSVHGLDAKAGIAVDTPAGAGPRHIEFSADGKYAYVVTELTCQVLVYAYADGSLTYLQAQDTLPEGFVGENIDAAIHFAPDRKTLLASNRGHDSLAVFTVAADGKLSRTQVVSVVGKTPREFTFAPNGAYVFVCNQDSATVDVLSVNQVTGALTSADLRFDFPRPVCLLVGTVR